MYLLGEAEKNKDMGFLHIWAIVAGDITKIIEKDKKNEAHAVAALQGLEKLLTQDNSPYNYHRINTFDEELDLQRFIYIRLLARQSPEFKRQLDDKESEFDQLLAEFKKNQQILKHAIDKYQWTFEKPIDQKTQDLANPFDESSIKSRFESSRAQFTIEKKRAIIETKHLETTTRSNNINDMVYRNSLASLLDQYISQKKSSFWCKWFGRDKEWIDESENFKDNLRRSQIDITGNNIDDYVKKLNSRMYIGKHPIALEIEAIKQKHIRQSRSLADTRSFIREHNDNILALARQRAQEAKESTMDITELFDSTLHGFDATLKDLRDKNRQAAEAARHLTIVVAERELEAKISLAEKMKRSNEQINQAENKAVQAINYINENIFSGKYFDEKEAKQAAIKAAKKTYELLHRAWSKSKPGDLLTHHKAASRAAAASLFLAYAIGRDREGEEKDINIEGQNNIKAAMGIYTALISTDKSFDEIQQVYSKMISSGGISSRLHSLCQEVMKWEVGAAPYVTSAIEQVKSATQQTEYHQLYDFHLSPSGNLLFYPLSPNPDASNDPMVNLSNAFTQIGLDKTKSLVQRKELLKDHKQLIIEREANIHTKKYAEKIMSSEFKGSNETYQNLLRSLTKDLPNDNPQRFMLERRAQAAALLYTYAIKRYQEILKKYKPGKKPSKDDEKALANIHVALQMYFDLIEGRESFQTIYKKNVEDAKYSFKRSKVGSSTLEDICKQIKTFEIKECDRVLITPDNWPSLHAQATTAFEPDGSQPNKPQQFIATKILKISKAMKQQAGDRAVRALDAKSPISPIDAKQLDAKANDELEILKQNLRLSIETKAQIDKIEGTPYLNEYYRSFIANISQIFTACQAIESGYVENKKQTKASYAVMAIDTVKDQLSFFPGANLVFGILSQGIAFMDEREKAKEAHAIAHLFSDPVTMMQFVEPLARHLTLQQESHLRQIKDMEPSSIFGKLRDIADRITGANQGAKALAIQHASSFWEAVLQGQIANNPGLSQVRFVAELLQPGLVLSGSPLAPTENKEEKNERKKSLEGGFG